MPSRQVAQQLGDCRHAPLGFIEPGQPRLVPPQHGQQHFSRAIHMRARDYGWITARGAPDWLAGNAVILLCLDSREADNAARAVAESV